MTRLRAILSFLIAASGKGEMMTKPQTKLGKLKASHLLIALGVVAVLGGYGWHLYALFRDSQAHMPQPQVEKLTRDLRLFHSRSKRFPASFNEINELLWHTKPMPDYGAEGRQARTKSYYYFYTRVKDDQCAIWAIPLGPRRQYAASFFLVVTPGWKRLWQGKALDEAMIAKLSAIPNADELSKLQLTEMRRERP